MKKDRKTSLKLGDTVVVMKKFAKKTNEELFDDFRHYSKKSDIFAAHANIGNPGRIIKISRNSKMVRVKINNPNENPHSGELKSVIFIPIEMVRKDRTCRAR